MNTEKIALRQAIRAEIEALPQEYIDRSNEGIYQNLISLPEFIEAKTIFAFYSLGREPNTLEMIGKALSMGKTVTLPLCYKGGVMEARAIKSLDELRVAMLKIPAPTENAPVVLPEMLDFIIVPALTFDREGYRLGVGGGYYDRYLLKTKAFTAGVARERLVRELLIHEAHDIPVKCLVTEKNAARFR
jgi:5-formyltetrahydrofolate cyclo-ligase